MPLVDVLGDVFCIFWLGEAPRSIQTHNWPAWLFSDPVQNGDYAEASYQRRESDAFAQGFKDVLFSSNSLISGFCLEAQIISFQHL